MITDEAAARTRARGVVETVVRALATQHPDVAVLVRMKGAPIDDVAAICRALRPITARARARILVHTHAALVSELALDGVHVDAHTDIQETRARVPSGALVGASRHRDDLLDNTTLAGADYVTLSPVFSPISKPSDTRRALGLDGLRAHALRSGIPMVALGGIHPHNAAACIRDGAAAVALTGAVMGALDPARALAETEAMTPSADADDGRAPATGRGR